MEIATLILEYAKVTVWPVTLILLLLLYRRPLVRLLGRVGSISYKDFRLDLDADLRELESSAERELATTVGVPDLGSEAETMPTMAILKTWRRVLDAANGLIMDRAPGTVIEGAEPFKQIEETLEGPLGVAPGKVKIFRDLRLLRNRVVHAPDYFVSPAQARPFVEAGAKLAQYFEEAKGG